MPTPQGSSSLAPAQRTAADRLEIPIFLIPMYLFNHIPKCAGSTYLHLFREALGATRVLQIDINGDQDYSLNSADYETYDCVMGHFSVRWNNAFGEQRRWLTALRDPIDRVVSTYYFWRNNVPSADLGYVGLAKSQSLDEFVRCGDPLVLQGISDLQVWQLADELRVKYRSVATADALEVAKENLEKFDFIGMYESMEESMRRFCAYLQCPVPAQFPHDNPTLSRLPVEAVGASTRSAIMDLNHADLELHRYAKNLLAKTDVANLELLTKF